MMRLHRGAPPNFEGDVSEGSWANFAQRWDRASRIRTEGNLILIPHTSQDTQPNRSFGIED